MELKEEIKQTKKDLETLEELRESVSTIKEDVFNVKADILGSAFVMLMQKMFKTVDDWAAVNSESVEQSKEFAISVKESIEKVITAISQQKAPTIELKPQVKVDMQPIANEISKQNETMIKLLNKLSNGDNGRSEELQRLVLLMTQKQITFLESGVKQFDYTEQLISISDGVNKSDKKIEKFLVSRGDYNLIKEIIPVYKK